MASYEKDRLPPWPWIRRQDHEGKPICERRGDIAVGLLVFAYDVNERVYLKPDGGAIERYHYVPRLVVSETRVSWVLDNGRKVPKKDLSGVFGLLDVDDAIWERQHWHRIGDKLRTVGADKLREVAKIIGYEAED